MRLFTPVNFYTEFAFEIGSGLLTEVRRLQSLLGERDKAIQDMKEEKDDLDKTIESLRAGLREQEQSSGIIALPVFLFYLTLVCRQVQGRKLESGSHSPRTEGPTIRLSSLHSAT
jgi:hypothetical protein